VTPLRGITRHEGRTFDWNSRHDEASRGYAVRTLVPAAPTRPLWWTGGVVLDQGEEGSCAGHAIVAEYAASPVRGAIGDAAAGHVLAVACYERARRIDGIADAEGEGTSVNAVMKVGRERGWWDGYSWAFGVEDVKRALIVGPVVIGIPWYESMYEARSGVVDVGGELVGGHCLLVTGWTPNYQGRGETFRWRNSWSRSYGVNGNGYISARALGELLADDGEAAVPTGRHIAR